MSDNRTASTTAAELFDGVMRFNNILMDFDRDLWAYIRCVCAFVPEGLAAVGGSEPG